MQNASDQVSAQTIDLLGPRLKRIEYVVFGQAVQNSRGITAVSSRLRDLEHAFSQMIAASRVRQDVLKLYAQYRELFENFAAEGTWIRPDHSIQLASVLAAASTYTLTASGLTSILDMPVPSAESSRQLILARAQIATLELVQESQAKEITELKQRSASVLQRWYSVDVLRTGEYWADVEEKIESVEQKVRRLALLQQQEKEGI
ncbi:MAG: hypothetical protein M1818_003219 [Claussenomyces sp. TS43310]|nr:MAG: hypothetical protein M1818_003219 [Claussenomyces sp. TS43310]